MYTALFDHSKLAQATGEGVLPGPFYWDTHAFEAEEPGLSMSLGTSFDMVDTSGRCDGMGMRWWM